MGCKFKRNPDTFRKFDAVVRAAAALEGVMGDTDTRRQQVRADIKATTESLQTASTLADVQKLQATLAAQSAELAAIDREREAAMNSGSSPSTFPTRMTLINKKPRPRKNASLIFKPPSKS